MQKKLISLIVISLLSNNLYGGFDFGGSDSCEGGSGTFQQEIEYWGGEDPENAVTVGTIPKDLKDIYISLKSDEDVDIRLYDANGKKIVHWPSGILSGGSYDFTTYKGVTIEYSGYNGDGTGLGHEYIKINGVTQNDFIMKAFGYKSGYAKVDYSWAGKVNCSDSSTPSASGSGDFEQQIIQDDIVKVGDIPPKVNNLYITLTSDEDVDIQLYDKDDGTKIIVWPDGILNGGDKQDTNYKGMQIEWSGYNGDGINLGHEYIKITGETTCNLTMKAYGYKAGYAKVHYEWGGEEQDNVDNDNPVLTMEDVLDHITVSRNPDSVTVHFKVPMMEEGGYLTGDMIKNGEYWMNPYTFLVEGTFTKDSGGSIQLISHTFKTADGVSLQAGDFNYELDSGTTSSDSENTSSDSGTTSSDSENTSSDSGTTSSDSENTSSDSGTTSSDSENCDPMSQLLGTCN